MQRGSSIFSGGRYRQLHQVNVFGMYLTSTQALTHHLQSEVMGVRGSTLVGPARIDARLLGFTKQDKDGVYNVSLWFRPF